MQPDWSEKPPTEEGHYWWRDGEGDNDPQVFYVVDLDNGSQPGPLFVTIGNEQVDMEKMGGQWMACSTPRQTIAMLHALEEVVRLCEATKLVTMERPLDVLDNIRDTARNGLDGIIL